MIVSYRQAVDGMIVSLPTVFIELTYCVYYCSSYTRARVDETCVKLSEEVKPGTGSRCIV
jgi:hypothetical protein